MVPKVAGITYLSIYCIPHFTNQVPPTVYKKKRYMSRENKIELYACRE
jgi:hypothetical protein